MAQMDIVDLLLNKIRADYKDDVAFVVVHGSTIYNETHAKSDVDLYYLAKTDRGNELSQVFILDGIGYDIWSIPWERLVRIASHEERSTSIITEGRLVYYGNDADLRRFNELKAIALDVSDRTKFINKAQTVLDDAYKSYYELLRSTGLYDARMCALRIVFAVTRATSLLNRITIKRGRGKLKAEIEAMPLVPTDFGVLYDTVFKNKGIGTLKRNYDALIKNTQKLIDAERRTVSNPKTFHEKMDKIYEEMINFYNKIRHACEVGDMVTALFAAGELQWEFEDKFAGTGVDARRLPNIMESFNPDDSSAFLKVVDAHQKAVLDLIKANHIQITEFGNIDQVRQFLSGIGAGAAT